MATTSQDVFNKRFVYFVFPPCYIYYTLLKSNITRLTTKKLKKHLATIKRSMQKQSKLQNLLNQQLF